MGAKGVTDFLLLPLLATFFGLLVFFLGLKKELGGGKAIWKWIGLLIVGLGAYSAWADFSLMIGIGDPFYVSAQKAQYDARRYVFSIYGGFIIPILAIGIAVLLNKILPARFRAIQEEN